MEEVRGARRETEATVGLEAMQRVQAGQRALELEPLNVSAYNYLIFALLAADRHAEAAEKKQRDDKGLKRERTRRGA